MLVGAVVFEFKQNLDAELDVRPYLHGAGGVLNAAAGMLPPDAGKSAP